jgi:hypothetical protein
MNIIRTCVICGKEFEDAPFYIREGGSFYPVCSVRCLHKSGEKLDNE